MSNYYQGTAAENLALDTYVKLARAFDSVKAFIDKQKTVGDLHGAQFGTL